MNPAVPLVPPARLGVVGGGQLGRMFVQAAQGMGYHTVVLTDHDDAPAADVAHEAIRADTGRLDTWRKFAKRVDAVTIEFENVPAASLRWLHRLRPVRPGWRPVWISQNRRREKAFLNRHGFPTAPWQSVRDAASLDHARQDWSGPCILKTAASGYDGKGQIRVESVDGLEPAWSELGRGVCVLEKVVAFVAEVSCIVARGNDGRSEVYPVFWNRHAQHILDLTICPAPVGPAATAQVQEMALGVAKALDYVGVLAIEFFLTEEGEVVINELAPRPHNSGHLTIEACATSQFEQQVRALCGLPLGSTRLWQPAAMANLLGDIWTGGPPDWAGMLSSDSELRLHLYAKKSARPGRKMGHLTVLDPDVESALRRVAAARTRLRAGRSD